MEPGMERDFLLRAEVGKTYTTKTCICESLAYRSGAVPGPKHLPP